MNEPKEITLTVTEFIKRVCKELGIEGTKGIYGNDLELIALVRNCQFLYDRSVPDFKDVQKKNEAWEAIGAVFGVTAGDVQLRWKNIRDVFSKCKNKPKHLDRTTRNLNCPHYEELRFLEPFVLSRNRLSIRSIAEAIINKEEDSKTKIFDRSATFVNINDIRLFIRRIKQTPILYHSKFKGQSNQTERLDAWQQICATFSLPLGDCLSRWRNLRERYSRERRLQKTNNTPSRWELFGDLCFLDQHVKQRKRTFLRDWKPNATNDDSKPSNMCYVLTSDTSQPESVVISSSNDKKTELEDVEFFDVSSELTTSPTDIFHGEHVDEGDEDDEEEEEEEEGEEDDRGDDDDGEEMADDKQMMEAASMDEDELFGKTIAAELKRLPTPKKKMKLKAAIYNLLYEQSCES